MNKTKIFAVIVTIVYLVIFFIALNVSPSTSDSSEWESLDAFFRVLMTIPVYLFVLTMILCAGNFKILKSAPTTVFNKFEIALNILTICFAVISVLFLLLIFLSSIGYISEIKVFSSDLRELLPGIVFCSSAMNLALLLNKLLAVPVICFVRLFDKNCSSQGKMAIIVRIVILLLCALLAVLFLFF